jgi:hypothetical protein
MARTLTCYLLHFTEPIPRDQRGTVQHYLGSAKDVGERIRQHESGTRAAGRLPQVFKERGIGFVVARIWTGGRDVERRLKNQKNAPRLCTVCKGQAQPTRPTLPGWDDTPPFA